ncbi:hypothetical protein N7486_000316 [Penicillium sp. IBT 16267x]|nr:hypothetical protein N7486_000316 [Penicillium sp. IBT 16267x]
MRYSLALLAGLAGTSLAYPAELSNERRTFGLVHEFLGSVGSEVGHIFDTVLGHHGSASGSVTLLAGLSARGAAALEGGALGCSHSTIHAGARAELKTWLYGQTHITGSLKSSLLSWCEGHISTLDAGVTAGLAVYIPTCADLAAKESIYVTIDGIFDASEMESTLILSASAQTSLTAFISANVDLDVEVRAGLHLCAAGGIIGSLGADIKASLLAWVQGADCGLSATLKASVLAWIKGEAGADLVAVGSISTDALTSHSVGASIEVLVEESGVLSASALASIAAFLEADVSVDIDVNVRAALTACAEGRLAAALSVDLRTSLAVWLSGSDCTLGVELKAVILLWLSVAVTAEASVDVVSGLFVDITSFMTEEIIAVLSVNLRGAFALLEAGESLTLLSWEARAELAAFLGGCTSIDISVSIELIITEWFTGCSIGSGSGSGSSPSGPAGSGPVPSGPAPTGPAGSGPVPSGPAATGPAGSGPVPSGPAPTGPAGSGPVPSGPAPTGPAGSGPVPSGPAPTGPAGSGPVPSGPAATGPAGSGPVPSGPAATGPAGSGPVPSGPAPTGPAGSGPVPSGPAATGPAGSGPVPSGPAATGPAGSGPVPSGPAATGPAGSGPVPSGPVPSGPAPSGPVGSGSIPSGPAPSGPVGSGSIPSGPAPTGSGSMPSGPIGSGSVPSGPAPTGSGSMPSGPIGSGSVPSGPAPTETAAMSTPCAGGAGAGETETISYSTAFTETIRYTETVSPPAVTAAPSGVFPEGSGAVTTVFVTKTVCGCE